MNAEVKFKGARSAWGSLLYWRHRFLRASRYRRARIERTGSMSLVVLPEVFNGVLLESGRVFAEALNSSLIPAGARVLDMGTGSGIVAIRAAQLGAVVTAVDINPEAVRCARINALLNRVEERVKVIEGDLFDPVRGERFDRVFFNPPFYRRSPKDALDAAWCSTDAFDRFLAGIENVLEPDGICLLLLSSRGDLMPALDGARLTWRTSAAATKDVLHEVFTLYRLEKEVQAAKIGVCS